MDLIIGQLIGFLIGVLSSWFFWILLLNTKPDIEISPVIAYSPDDKFFRIKISNEGNRQIIDIQATLTLSERYPVPWGQSRGKIHLLKEIKLKNDEFALGPKSKNPNNWGLLQKLVFSTEEAEEVLMILKTPCEFDRRLVFTLRATDAISNTTIVKRVVYRFEDVRYGKFRRGFEVTYKGYRPGVDSE